MSIADRRNAPALVAGALALAYVLISPPSIDLAAHLLRAKLFGAEGFGLWNNWWYGGHHTLAYSVLFPPLAWLLTPQIVAAAAVTGSAIVFERLAFDHGGEDSLPASIWFAAATVTILLSGRLTFALGLLPALGTALALQRGRTAWAIALATLTALMSPVASLFAALAGAANALSANARTSRTAGAAVLAAALLPVLALAVAFPEGGTEPFAFSSLWPIPVLAAVGVATVPREARVLRAGVFLYALGCIAAYALPTPVGGNAARLGPLLAGPIAALLWLPRKRRWLALALVPLLYLQWHDGIDDLVTASGDRATNAAYYAPLLRFLERQGGAPFRIEIPFTRTHWEAYEVAGRFPLARGWERQLDRGDNPLFYRGRLTAARYDRWLRRLAVRFVAVPDVGLDYSAEPEAKLIARGLPDLRPLADLGHWRVYSVRNPTAIVSGPATLEALGPDSLSLKVTRSGRSLARVRFSPYWTLSGVPGCVAPAGDFTELTFRRAGPARLTIAFDLSRVAARSPRCN